MWQEIADFIKSEFVNLVLIATMFCSGMVARFFIERVDEPNKNKPFWDRSIEYKALWVCQRAAIWGAAIMFTVTVGCAVIKYCAAEIGKAASAIFSPHAAPAAPSK